MRITKTIVLILFSFVQKTTALAFLFCTCLVNGQVNDNFADGDFTTDPPWLGDTTKFIVSYSSAVPPSQQPALKLDASGTDTSILVVPSFLLKNTEWQFWVKLSFNTSSNNFARIYLASDQLDLNGSLNGYFVQFGGFVDSLGLYKQSGNEVEALIVGSNVYTGNSTNQIRVKVQCSVDGEWTLFADEQGGNAFLFEGECVENDDFNVQFFGVYCKYTSSNSSKFYFDDIYVNEIVLDTLPPGVVDIELLSSSEIILEFSEGINGDEAQNTNNYFVNNGIGHPVEAVFYGPSQQLVWLIFNTDFVIDETYLVEVENITDYSGNINPHQEIPFIYASAQTIPAHSIVINEIMADVNPIPAGLPALEYLELFNPTFSAINMNGLYLKPGNSLEPQSLPEIIIGAEGYLIVTHVSNVEQFLPYGQVIGLQEFSLNNSGNVELSDEEGRVIHAIEYDKSTYRHEIKSEGGWSLEQIDPYNPCLAGNNWIASLAATGGSPGSVNSVNEENYLPIEIVQAVVQTNSELFVEFNQGLGNDFLAKKSLIDVDRGMGSPTFIYPQDSSYTSFFMIFNEDYQVGKVYTISFAQPIVNCVGLSESVPVPFSFGLPEPPNWNDIVINEILFNPAGKGADFIELYNKSQKVLNLADLQLGSISADQFGVYDSNYKVVSVSDCLLLPDEYMALTKDPEMVQQQYVGGDPVRFKKMESFPSYANSEGIAVVSNLNGKRIDIITYNESQHHPLLTTVEGVSLERINPDRSSAELTNWHSASSLSGFGTPALQNSQFSKGKLHDDELLIDPKVFSPDNDGYYDVVNICYEFESPGFSASVVIFDASGRPVRFLMNNELLGQKGIISWDGVTEEGHKASLGIYIIYFEAFDPKGSIKKIKKTVVVAGKLK